MVILMSLGKDETDRRRERERDQTTQIVCV